jgi:hypothetical protein
MHANMQNSVRLMITTLSLVTTVAVLGVAATSVNASPLALGKSLGGLATAETDVVPARWWHHHHRYHAWWWHRHHWAYARWY